MRQTVSEATYRIQTIIDAAERVAAEIRAEAQTEASRYVQEAKREADRLTMERIGMISELSDALIEHATRVRQQSDGLISALEQAMRQITAASSRAAAATARGEGATGLEPREEGIRPVPEPAPGPISESAPGPTPEPPVEPETTAGASATSEPPSGDDSPAVGEREHAGTQMGGTSTPSEAASRREVPTEAAMLRATQMAVAGSRREEIGRALATEFGIRDPARIVDQILGPPSPY